MRVAIVGGSVAGLSVSLLLLRAGHEVHVFERSPSLDSEAGGGIVVQPALEALFRELGLSLRTEDVDGRRFFDSSGRSQVAPGPQRMTSWSAIWKPLRLALPDGVYHAGAKVAGVEAAGDGLRIQFADAADDPGVFDFVVGADGAQSSVRRSLLDDGLAPEYAGYVAWRGLVSVEDLPAETSSLFERRFAFYHAENTHVLFYIVPTCALESEPVRQLNWVWYWNVPPDELKSLLVVDSDTCPTERLPERFSVPPGRLNDRATSMLRELAAAQLPSPLKEIVLDTKRPFMQPIYDFVTSAAVLAEGKAALIGDSKAFLRPHTAYGAAQAAEDALSLAAALGASSSVSIDRLKRWEHQVLDAGHSMSSYGRRLGRSQNAKPGK